MKWVLAVALVACLGVAPTPRERKLPGSAATTRAARFTFVDIRIDAKGKPLAAYQVEFVADAQRVKLVGIEGGDVAAFAQPPYYDPAALSRNRVIVAAFNTGKDLPSKPFRAARLHLQISGESRPNWKAKLITAAGADGAVVQAGVNVGQGVEP